MNTGRDRVKDEASMKALVNILGEVNDKVPTHILGFLHDEFNNLPDPLDPLPSLLQPGIKTSGLRWREMVIGKKKNLDVMCLQDLR